MRVDKGTIAVVSLLALFSAGDVLAGAGPTPATAPAAAPQVDVVPRRGLPGRDVALLVSGQQGGPIAVSIKVFPSASAGRTQRVPWIVDIPGFTLASLTEGGALDLEFAVYLQRKSGEIVGHEESVFHISDVPAAWQSGGGLKVLGYVDASFPPTALRVLVREPSSGAFGSWEMPVPTRAGGTPRSVDFGPAVVTDAQGGSGAMVGTGFQGMTGRSGLLALVAPDPAQGWVVVGVGGADARRAPFSLAGAGAVPATRPVVRPGSALKVALLGEGLPGNLEARARVIYTDGRPPVACAARILSRLPAPAGPFERLDVVVSLPSDIPPGEHGLVVTCRPVGGLDAGSVGTQFRVAPPDKAGTALSWPAIPIDESGRVVALATPDVAPRSPDEEAPPQLRAAYRAAVARYVADGTFSSLRKLVEFERAALAGRSGGDMSRLASAERSLARSVGKVSRQALLGLCLVELDAYREHSRDAASLAIGHSRRMIEEMAEMLAAEGRGAEGKREAAAVLTIFAAELQAVSSYGTADRLFARAATLDRDDVAALIGRAAILECLGDTGHVIDLLEQALALRPGDAEARLRLGVNLRRAGREAEARKELTGCTAADRPSWVRAVAWQELAALELEARRPADALRTLRQAAAALPDDEGLRVLLASTLDQQHHYREALTVVNSVVGHPNAGAESARLLYAQPPRGELDAVRGRLDEARPRCIAALAAADQEERR